jgi:very-short-patch-repair endonuclease
MTHRIHSLRGIPDGKYREAHRLRRDMTASERMLWTRLRRNQVAGCHFRRQHVIRGFIVDFYCHKAKLVMEVDGGIHRSQAESDRIRDDVLRSEGILVLRISNERIEKGLEQVLNGIEEICIKWINLQSNR